MSARPSKIYLYKLFDKVLKDYVDFNKSSLLDMACGDADLLQRNKIKDYTGVDLDINKIDLNKIKFKDKKFYFDDILKFEITKKFDFLVCLETITANTIFDLEHKPDGKKIELLSNNMEKNLLNNGVIFLNISSSFFNNFVKSFLKNRNLVIEKKIRYGVFNGEYPYLISRFLKYFENIKILREIFGKNFFLIIRKTI